MNQITKEDILKEIEALLEYDTKTQINPNYLQYFEINELIEIKNNLTKDVKTIVDENIDWLEQFKK